MRRVASVLCAAVLSAGLPAVALAQNDCSGLPTRRRPTSARPRSMPPSCSIRSWASSSAEATRSSEPPGTPAGCPHFSITARVNAAQVQLPDLNYDGNGPGAEGVEVIAPAPLVEGSLGIWKGLAKGLLAVDALGSAQLLPDHPGGQPDRRPRRAPDREHRPRPGLRGPGRGPEWPVPHAGGLGQRDETGHSQRSSTAISPTRPRTTSTRSICRRSTCGPSPA